MTRTDLARRIYEAAHLTGSFVLRSGQTSNEYFDKYRFESDPILLKAIGEQMAALVSKEVTRLAGLEMGGIPLATALSFETGLSTLFVRKEAKPYGTRRLAEGGEIEGERLLIVEDVISTGGQVVESGRALESLGATIVGVLCVIDRESGGRENIAQAGWTLQSLFTKSQLEAAANLS